MSLLSNLLTPPSANKKNSFSTKRLYANKALTSILFQPITAWLFPIAAPFPVLSILTIPLDKCHTKSFENIDFLIKVKVDLHSVRFFTFLLLREQVSPFYPHFVMSVSSLTKMSDTGQKFSKKNFLQRGTALF